MSRQKGQRSPRNVTIGLRAKAWWSLRKNKAATIPDLMTTHCEGTEKTAWNNLNGYLRALAKVGILTVDDERRNDGKPTSNGLKVWRLARDVGPKAPVVRRNLKEVFDPNSGASLTPCMGTVVVTRCFADIPAKSGHANTELGQEAP